MINGVANGPLYFFFFFYMGSLAQTSSGARYHGEVLEGFWCRYGGFWWRYLVRFWKVPVQIPVEEVPEGSGADSW